MDPLKRLKQRTEFRKMSKENCNTLRLAASGSRTPPSAQRAE